ncbi:MAG: hypothetical protein Q8K67_08190 [Geothrix sp.]|nr:hypothetical protein [Geothrix sp.]
MNMDANEQPEVKKVPAFIRIVDVLTDLVVPIGLGVLLVELLPSIAKTGMFIIAVGIFARVAAKRIREHYQAQ